MKKGMIDKYGNLHILRGGVLKPMECPRVNRYLCCDKCALFGEPEPVEASGETELELCTQTLYFDEFEDQR